MNIPSGVSNNFYTNIYKQNASQRPGHFAGDVNDKANTLTMAEEFSDPEVKQAKKAGKIECETCKNRKYQDGSDDPGVSFKTPGHIDPDVSASAVMAHEQEHVRNEQAKASAENREVVYQNVKLDSSVCPECGTPYISRFFGSIK